MDRRPILIQKQRTSGRIGKGNGVRVEDGEKVSIYEIRVKGHLGWRRSE
jgi:hypothetical protein